jgi:hypothetical protein
MKLTDSIEAQINLICTAEGVDRDLVKAIVMTESAGNTWAVRYEPHWKYFTEVQNHATKARISYETERTCQAMSWGLMQIMGSVCRELLYDGDLTKLCQEDIGLKYGIKKLKTLLKKYVKQDDAIAAYNAGIPKLRADGKYMNQPYVDGVNAFLKIIKGQKQ